MDVLSLCHRGGGSPLPHHANGACAQQRRPTTRSLLLLSLHCNCLCNTLPMAGEPVNVHQTARVHCC